MYRQYPLDTWKLIEHQQDKLRRDADHHRLQRACGANDDRRVVRWAHIIVSSLLVALGLIGPAEQRAKTQDASGPVQREELSPASYSDPGYEDLYDGWLMVHSGRVRGPFWGYRI